jgi:HlyD family secretion protein
LKKRIIIAILICLFLVAGILLFNGQKNGSSRGLYYSGTVEATQAELAFQVSGRVVNVPAEEGEFVEKGRILAVLDQSEYQARYEQALANLESKAENLKKLELVAELDRKTLPDEVARADAGLKVLRSQLRELESGYREQDIERARLAVLSSRDIMEEAKKNRDRYYKLFQDKLVSEKEWDAIELKYETVLKEYESYKESFDMLQEGTRKEAIQTARDKVVEGEIVLKQAKDNLKKIEAAEKEVYAAKAQVKSAQSELELAKTQLGYTTLKAPFNGIITSRNVEIGEVVTAASEVLSLSDLSYVDLKIFVDETEIGKVKPGQNAEVKIDSFPEKVYKGKVSFVSPEGEFTPKMIQTQKERVKLVYLVKISIPNPELELKSGMPADAWLR